MIVTIKVIFWAIIFVITNGAVFADYFKNNKILSALSGLFALLSSIYLFDAMGKDMQDKSGYTLLLYILMAIIVVLTIWHILKEQSRGEIDNSDKTASASPKISHTIEKDKTKITSDKTASASSKISHTIEKDKTQIKQGTFENDNDYNKRVTNTLFLVGIANMKSYNPNSHTMELELRFDKDIEPIKPILKEINSNARITLNNSDAKLLFGEQTSREFYISTKATENSLYIDSAFLISKEREYSINIDIAWIDNLMVEDTPITKRYTHKEAEQYASNLRLGGYNDWRLPTKKELLNIYKHKSKLNNIKDIYFWTSTINQDNSTQAWVVSFDFGDGRWYNKTDTLFVRCVR